MNGRMVWEYCQVQLGQPLYGPHPRTRLAILTHIHLDSTLTS